MTHTGEDRADDDETIEIDAPSPDAPPTLATVAAAQRYSLGHELGRGGMGEVVLARDELFGREVALKRLRIDCAGGEREQRFIQEAMIQARLQHPAIVPVHDVGLWDDRPYFTMRAIRGQTLAEIVATRDGPSDGSVNRMLSLLERVCLAVHFAHVRGVIHRDLKPSNIMVGEFGEVYVLDWGVARAKAMSTEMDGAEIVMNSPDETREGTVVGSVAYMAPEQLAGRNDAIGPAADVYALGAIAFEVLTNQRLHPRDVPRRADEPVDVDAQLRSRGLEIAPELADIVQRAVAHDPAQRLSSARELAEAFERFAAGDRDRELRRELSRRCTDRASALIDGADRAGRTSAMREIGRALALDPDNSEAMQVLVALLSTPMHEVPAEVESALEETVGSGTRAMARAAMRSYACIVPFFGVALWMGVRDLRALFAIATLVLLAVVTIVVGQRSARPRRTLAPSIGWATLFVASAGGVFGPFVVTPVVALVAFSYFVLHLGPRHLPALIALVSSSMLAPAILQWLDVLPASYRFANGELVVTPILVDFTPLPTIVMLAGSSVVAVAVGLASLARFRVLLQDAERRAQMQAWQISRLLPAVQR